MTDPELIHNIRELCGSQSATDEHAKKIVEKNVFKYTRSGCTFSANETGVTLGAYCEGSDSELDSVFLKYPFQLQEYYRNLQLMDDAGCDEWNRTHGCEFCYKDDFVPGCTPINPDCKSCNGDGIIL